MTVKSIFLLLLCVILVIFLSILITPGFKNIKHFIELALVGRLEVPGVAPEVIAVYLENNPCDEPGGANRPIVNPLENSYRNIMFNATVYSINGNCNGNVTFYICANETAIPPTYCNENYNVSSIIVSTPYATSGNNMYCNYSGFYSLPYFRRCGNWYVNVTAFDTTGKSNSTVRWWKDNLLGSVWYPYVNGQIGDLIYMGSVNLSQWNYNMGRNTTKNTGNINVTILRWNATNFTRVGNPNDVIPIVLFGGNTTFAIDNDTNIMNGAGYIDVNPSVQIQFPSYGLDRCEDFDCNSARAKYDFWWHLYVPPVPSGIYENEIQYNISAMSCT